MILVLMFLGLVLSIIKANGWIVVPTYCVVFCWIVSIFSWMIYSYAKGIGEEVSKTIKEQIKKNKEE